MLTHTHMLTPAHTAFLLWSLCLLPITEVYREGPCDWLTGCPEDKQVYVLAMYQGWISSETEKEGQQVRSNREREQPRTSTQRHKHAGLIACCRGGSGGSTETWQLTVVCFSRSHLLLRNGIIIKRHLVNLPCSPAPQVEINVSRPVSLDHCSSDIQITLPLRTNYQTGGQQDAGATHIMLLNRLIAGQGAWPLLSVCLWVCVW